MILLTGAFMVAGITSSYATGSTGTEKVYESTDSKTVKSDVLITDVATASYEVTAETTSPLAITIDTSVKPAAALTALDTGFSCVQSVEQMFNGVTESDIEKFLQRKGYTVYSMELEEGTGYAIVQTSHPNLESTSVRVETGEGVILGWEDIQ